MTLTIDLSPEAEAQLQTEATNRGQSANEYAREAFQAWLRLAAVEPDSEAELVADWKTASARSLREVWDNDEDAVYDTL